MINNLKVLAIIPARGGSKGIPRKNLLFINERPLLSWTVEATKKSLYIDKAILSSDDPEIIDLGRSLGLEVPFVRPHDLAGDSVSCQEVVTHVLEKLPGFDLVVLLQPTSPLRTSEDIDKCIELCSEEKTESVISATIPDKSPFWMFMRSNSGQWVPILDKDLLLKQRQELPKVIAPNGAVYVAKTTFYMQYGSFFSKTMQLYEMPKQRSLDIDDNLDILVFKSILDHKNGLYPEKL